MNAERSPMRLCRKECLNCLCGNSAEIRRCTGNVPFGALHKPCPLWPYRFGRRPYTWDQDTFGRRFSARKAIRKYCNICQGGQRKMVVTCPSTDCVLWTWKLGTPEEYKLAPRGIAENKQ